MTTPNFVVEHRDGAAVAVVAEELVPLVRLAAQLLSEGKGGELVVRNPDTGHIHLVYPLDRALDQPAHLPGQAMPHTSQERRHAT